MGLSAEIWFWPALVASLGSFLAVRVALRRVKRFQAMRGSAGFLAGLSFLMGAICSAYRTVKLDVGMVNNLVVMFIVGIITSLAWLYWSSR